MKLAPVSIIGFSGHRGLKDEKKTAAALRVALQRLRERLGREGSVDLYSSVAWGSDLLALEAAKELEMAIHLILPMEESEFKKDFSAERNDGVDHMAEWARAEALLKLGREPGTPHTLRVVRGSHQRPDCYYDAGCQVLDGSDALLAVWDGHGARGIGGTQQMVALARKRKLPLVIIDPDNGVISEENLPPDIGGNTSWSDPVVSEVNRFVTRAAPPPLEAGEVYSHGLRLQKTLGSEARRLAPDFRRGIVAAVKLHAAATVLAAITACFLRMHDSLSMGIAAALTVVELGLVIRAWQRLRRLDRLRVKEEWITARYAAELIRGSLSSQPRLDPLHPLITRHSMRWRVFARSAALLIRRECNQGESREKFQDRYLAQRILRQKEYFEREGRTACDRHHRLYFWAHVAAHTTIWFVVTALLLKCAIILAFNDSFLAAMPWAGPSSRWVRDIEHKPVWTQGIEIFKSFLPIALPVFAGFTSTLRTALDASRRGFRYPEMAAQLGAVADYFGDLKTDTTVNHAVMRTEEVLLDELIEWELATRNSRAH